MLKKQEGGHCGVKIQFSHPAVWQAIYAIALKINGRR
jgi:hypothetical protein